MLEAFEAMAAYLADDSQLDIYSDNDHTQFIIQSGRVIQTI